MLFRSARGLGYRGRRDPPSNFDEQKGLPLGGPFTLRPHVDDIKSTKHRRVVLTGEGAMTDVDPLKQFVADQVESLRPRLLDFSRNNPLVSTRLGDRSASTLRIVNCSLAEIFGRLVSGKLPFAPLPPLNDDPIDESTERFQTSLSEARLVDPEYLSEVEAVDEDAEDATDLLLKIERRLKDRVRIQLGLRPRQAQTGLSIQQHARNNHIDPSYDLREVGDDYDQRSYRNDILQTLLLPDTFRRRLNSIITKRRTFLQET